MNFPLSHDISLSCVCYSYIHYPSPGSLSAQALLELYFPEYPLLSFAEILFLFLVSEPIFREFAVVDIYRYTELCIQDGITALCLPEYLFQGAFPSGPSERQPFPLDCQTSAASTIAATLLKCLEHCGTVHIFTLCLQTGMFHREKAGLTSQLPPFLTQLVTQQTSTTRQDMHRLF